VLQAIQRDFPTRPGRHSTTARAILTREVAHIPDAAADPEYALRAILQTGVHTMLSVPILQDGNPVGAITVTRLEVSPFSQAQIDLLKTFADQAVIAIENVRLFNELNERTRDLEESLEYQTATSDVLNVISRSTADVQPVLDIVAETAARLCGSDVAVITIREGKVYRYVAANQAVATDAEIWAALRQRTIVPGRDSMAGRVALEGRVVHVADILADPDYAQPEAMASGVRTNLGVPLLRDGAVIGTINLGRKRVQPFTERQIELVRTFADQAVIAMENARLLGELQTRTHDLEESLEYQTATSDVLNVISRSTADVQPVLDTVVETAARLCSAGLAAITIREGEVYRYVASNHAVAADTELWAALRQRTVFPGRETLAGRVVLEGKVVHIADIRADPDYAWPEAVASGLRTILGVPLLREGAVLGTINLARNRVQPYTERQIELVRTFADQAVIAIENARLLDEIRQRQAELRVTFDNMVDGVAMFDEALHLAAWNRNFQQLLDLPEEFLAERHDFDTYIRYLVQRGEFGETAPEKEIARLRARIGDHYSYERTRPEGTIIEVRHNPMPGGGIVLIYSDITERKRSEAEIRAARDAAEAAYRDLKAAQASLIQAEKMASLGQLTAGIAHEIKNPLNFVNNFADLSVELLDELKETAAPAIAALDDDKRTEIDETINMLTGNLEKIAEHGRRADGIVKSMLEHSRGTSGERRSVDLNGLIDEALNLAYHGGRAQDASFNITLERDFAEAIAPIELVPQDITRVCLNLIGNGFYAATKRQKQESDPAFKPTLKVSTRDLGDAVEVRVRDNGVGIAPEIRDKLFQPFFTTKPTGEGTGLGLSISYDIVTQQHAGTITVDSQVGGFTEFTVRLPRTLQRVMAEAAS
jgi:signal transduction histidine kinase